MFTYEVYNFDYDDTTSFELMHKTRFTKEEYENIVNTCRIKVEEKIKRNAQIIETLNENEISEEEIESLELWSCSGNYHMLNNIYKIMIEEYGFEEKKKPLYTFTLNGGFYGEGDRVENRVID